MIVYCLRLVYVLDRMHLLLIGAHLIGSSDMMIMRHHISFQHSIKANFNVHILNVSSLLSMTLFCGGTWGARIVFETSTNKLVPNQSHSEKQSNDN